MTSSDEIQSIAEAAAEKAVAKMMFNLGIDVEDNDGVERAREYMRHLRRQYEACETVKRHGLKTFITAFSTVAMGVVGYIISLIRG